MRFPAGQCALYTLLTLMLVVVALGGTMQGAAWPFGSKDDADKAITMRSKDEQIVFWENEVQSLRDRELSRAHDKLFKATEALSHANRNSGWFKSSEDKARIRLLDEEIRAVSTEVEGLRKEESRMLAKLKPLYGIVSRQFVHEQRNVIAGSLKTIQTLSYDQAWYSSLFSVGDAESISDLIIGFFVQWLFNYVLMFPFAFLYYALWQAPWSILEYSSGSTDLVTGTVAWLVAVTIMALPLLAFVGVGYVVAKRYKPTIEQMMRERERRHRHMD